METKKGIITSVEAKQTSTGSNMWTIHFGKVKYNVFEPLNFNVGDFVEYDLEQNGKFFNISNIKPCSDPKPQTPAEVSSLSSKGDDEFHLTLEQCRSNALECAIKVTKKLGTDDYVGDLMSHAIEFEKYILTGEVSEDKVAENDK